MPRLVTAVRVVSPRPSGKRKTKDAWVRPASPGRSAFAPCPRGPAAGLEPRVPGVPHAVTSRGSPRFPAAVGKMEDRGARGTLGRLGAECQPRPMPCSPCGQPRICHGGAPFPGRDAECGMWMEGETPGLPRKAWGLCGSRASRGRRRPPTPPPRLRRASPRSSGCAFRRRRG